MTTITREAWERMGQDRALADALDPQPGATEHWAINDLARFFADGAQIAERQAAKELDSLRTRLTDMERARDVSRGNAAMHMEAARNLAVQLEAAQATPHEDAMRYRWIAAECSSSTDHGGKSWSIHISGEPPKYHDSEDHFDAAIDAAIHKAREQSK
jgi:hypothetical protein